MDIQKRLIYVSDVDTMTKHQDGEMIVKLNIQKWGNSAAIRLPASMLAQIGAVIGDAIEVDPTALKVAKPKYKLADLLEQCDKNAPPPADMAAWDAMKPVGNEVL